MRVKRLVDAWKEEERERDEVPKLERAHSAVVSGNVALDEKRPNVFSQSVILTSRASKNAARAHPELYGQLAQAVAIGLATGAPFSLHQRCMLE